VQEGIYDKFTQQLVKEVAEYHIGNGADDSATHNPLATSIAKVKKHIQDAISKKASILLRGNSLPKIGSNFLT